MNGCLIDTARGVFFSADVEGGGKGGDAELVMIPDLHLDWHFCFMLLLLRVHHGSSLFLASSPPFLVFIALGYCSSIESMTIVLIRYLGY